MSWIINHLTEISLIFGAIVTIGVTVSKFTKTDKDDKFWARVKSINFKKILDILRKK